MKDLGSYTFPCNVGSMHFEKTLCDLRFGISLMPISVAITCSIHRDLKPTHIYIQLADKLVVMTKGVVEDVLVRVDKFIIPVDFMVLDI